MTDLKTLAMAATPGPWQFGISEWNQETNKVVSVKPFDYESGGYCDNPGIFGATDRMIVGCDEYDVFSCEADRAYLTAVSPDAILKLLEERDRLREALAQITEVQRSPIGDSKAFKTIGEIARQALESVAAGLRQCLIN